MKKTNSLLLTISVFLVTLIAVSTYSAVFLFSRNIKEIDLSVFLPSFWLLLGIGVIVFVLSALITWSLPKGTVLGTVATLLLFNFTTILNLAHNVVPAAKYWHVLLVLLFGLGHIAYFIRKKLKVTMARDFAALLAILFCVLQLINIVPAAIQLSSGPQNNAQTDTQQSRVHLAVPGGEDLPNVYQFIFDEYANFPALEQYFDYDNLPLKSFLEQNGFAISYDSINEAQITSINVPNYFHYDLVLSEDDIVDAVAIEVLADELLYYPPMQSLMEEAGYEIKVVSSQKYICTNLEPQNKAMESKAADMGGRSFMEILLDKTAFYPFFIENADSEAQAILSCFEYFESLDYDAQNQVYTPAYVNTPHAPFLFNRTGGNVNRENYNNWKTSKYYLDQLIFITGKMITMLDTILENDPDCVIILQSDHGCRMLEDADGGYAIDWTNRHNILNAVYFRGEDISEIKGRSGVDTIRTVLNRLFELDLPMLEEEVL